MIWDMAGAARRMSSSSVATIVGRTEEAAAPGWAAGLGVGSAGNLHRNKVFEYQGQAHLYPSADQETQKRGAGRDQQAYNGLRSALLRLGERANSLLKNTFRVPRLDPLLPRRIGDITAAAPVLPPSARRSDPRTSTLSAGTRGTRNAATSKLSARKS